MKRTVINLLAAVAVLASCQEEPVVIDPTLSVDPVSVVLESAGGSKTVNVDANNPWTAEVTSGTDWITVNPSSASFSVAASANPSHENRMGSITVKSDKLSKVVSVTQLASPNNDKIEVDSASLTFEAAGGTQNVNVNANVTVTASASESWVTVSPATAQSGKTAFAITAAAYTGSDARNAMVTFSGGDAESVTVAISQNPAAFITPSNTAVTAPAEGTEVTVSVTSNVNWTAASSADWVTVSPASGQNADIKIAVAANSATEKRNATVTLTGDKASATINVEQDAAVVNEKLLAMWRCDDATYVESHSPDWSTEGANDYSHGTGKGIALPEDGAPEGTFMTWVRVAENSFPLVFITAAEGHYAVKSTAGGDGYVFSIPGQNLKKGQVVSIDCGLASGANTLPKNWVAKFRISESAEWTVGECSNAYTTASGATAHLLMAKTKDYTAASRFLATYTIPADASGATIQVFVCAADDETIKGKTASGSTVRLIPLYGMDGSAEFPGPRILIK